MKSDMIEVVYKEDSSRGATDQGGVVKLPKNVTQIGAGPGNKNLKIYMENDVLESIKDSAEDAIKYGVFLGKREREDAEYIFVKNHVSVRSNKENIILFNDDVWLYVYDEIKRKGYEGDIVGWYVIYPENRNKNLGQLKKLHLDNFAGINKILFCMEQENSEEGVYIYNNNILEKQPVYYVYWGKGGSVKSQTGRTGSLKGSDTRRSIINKDEKNSGRDVDKESVRKMPWGSVAMIAVLIGVLAFMGNSGMLSGVMDRAAALVQQGTSKEEPSMNQVNAENKTTEDKNGDEQTTTEGQNDEEDETTTKEQDDEDETTTKDEEGDETTTAEQDDEETTTAGEVSGEVLGTTYIVAAGETLYDICRAHYGSLEMVDEIVAANGIENPDKIYTGQKLILP